MFKVQQCSRNYYELDKVITPFNKYKPEFIHRIIHIKILICSYTYNTNSLEQFRNLSYTEFVVNIFITIKLMEAF